MDSAISAFKLSKLVPSPSKRALFLSTYRQNQAWFLPDSLIYYITKNPSSSKVYENLIKSCKYFFIKNPILIGTYFQLYLYDNNPRTSFNGKRIDLKNITSKIWVTYGMDIENFNDQNFSSKIIPKIFKSDINKLYLENQSISLDDLIFLTSKCEGINFSMAAVKNNDESIVTLEKVIEALPNIKGVKYDNEDTYPNVVTSETVKEMIKIPHFLTLKYLDLTDVPESFNLDDFYSYIKKNIETSISFKFDVRPLSDAYKYRLQEIVNEILQTNDHDHGYKVPLITFPGINESSYKKLYDLHLLNDYVNFCKEK